MYIVGVDEAGRGPLAGPVAVGVVCVPHDYDVLGTFPGLNDSKKLTEKKRDVLFEILQRELRAGNIQATVTLASVAMIDGKGIAPAVRHGVSKGIEKLLPNPADGEVFLDGSLVAPAEYRQQTVVGGDGTIPAIMLAALAAKVTRDRYMQKLDGEYPLYGFGVHKGYGTKAHREAIQQYGPSAAHRMSFLRNVLAEQKK